MGRRPEAVGLAIVCFALHCCSTLSSAPNVPVCCGMASSVRRRAHLPWVSLAGERELGGEKWLVSGGLEAAIILYPGAGCMSPSARQL